MPRHRLLQSRTRTCIPLLVAGILILTPVLALPLPIPLPLAESSSITTSPTIKPLEASQPVNPTDPSTNPNTDIITFSSDASASPATLPPSNTTETSNPALSGPVPLTVIAMFPSSGDAISLPERLQAALRCLYALPSLLACGDIASVIVWEACVLALIGMVGAWIFVRGGWRRREVERDGKMCEMAWKDGAGNGKRTGILNPQRTGSGGSSSSGSASPKRVRWVDEELGYLVCASQHVCVVDEVGEVELQGRKHDVELLGSGAELERR